MGHLSMQNITEPLPVLVNAQQQCAHKRILSENISEKCTNTNPYRLALSKKIFIQPSVIFDYFAIML